MRREMMTTSSKKKDDLDVGGTACVVGFVTIVGLLMSSLIFATDETRDSREISYTIFFGATIALAISFLWISLWRRMGVIIRNQHDLDIGTPPARKFTRG